MTFCEVNPYANRALAYALLGMEAEAHENIDRAVELGATATFTPITGAIAGPIRKVRNGIGNAATTQIIKILASEYCDSD